MSGASSTAADVIRLAVGDQHRLAGDREAVNLARRVDVAAVRAGETADD
jgi:hypothetical protein